MKKLRLLIALLFLASIAFTSCSDDPFEELDTTKIEQESTDNNDDDPAPPEPPTGS